MMLSKAAYDILVEKLNTVMVLILSNQFKKLKKLITTQKLRIGKKNSYS